jgi:hypothetical protein
MFRLALTALIAILVPAGLATSFFHRATFDLRLALDFLIGWDTLVWLVVVSYFSAAIANKIGRRKPLVGMIALAFVLQLPASCNESSVQKCHDQRGCPPRPLGVAALAGEPFVFYILLVAVGYVGLLYGIQKPPVRIPKFNPR